VPPSVDPASGSTSHTSRPPPKSSHTSTHLSPDGGAHGTHWSEAARVETAHLHRTQLMSMRGTIQHCHPHSRKICTVNSVSGPSPCTSARANTVEVCNDRHVKPPPPPPCIDTQRTSAAPACCSTGPPPPSLKQTTPTCTEHTGHHYNATEKHRNSPAPRTR
jgi:hypothetical protein